jgi:DNA-directed RNA polymerase subunit RPC12/RpoP
MDKNIVTPVSATDSVRAGPVHLDPDFIMCAAPGCGYRGLAKRRSSRWEFLRQPLTRLGKYGAGAYELLCENEELVCPKCGKKARNVKPRPIALVWLAVFGLLTAAPTLWYSSAWSLPTGSQTSFQIFERVFDYLDVPLNLLLLAASIGVLLPPKPWARQWMLWYAVVATGYETVQLLIVYLWIGAGTTPADLGGDRVEILDSLKGAGIEITASSYVNSLYALYWVSILSLTTYAYWVLTRPHVRRYFEADHAGAPVSISAQPSPRRQA